MSKVARSQFLPRPHPDGRASLDPGYDAREGGEGVRVENWKQVSKKRTDGGCWTQPLQEFAHVIGLYVPLEVQKAPPRI